MYLFLDGSRKHANCKESQQRTSDDGEYRQGGLQHSAEILSGESHCDAQRAEHQSDQLRDDGQTRIGRFLEKYRLKCVQKNEGKKKREYLSQRHVPSKNLALELQPGS